MTNMIKKLLPVVLFAIGSKAIAHENHEVRDETITTKEISYSIGDDNFTAFYAADATKGDQKLPGIIVVHEWWGHNDYVRKRAKQLAKLGYAALALDMYGSGKLAEHPDDAKGFMQAVVNTEGAAIERFDRAVSILKNQTEVDPEQLAAIGYCFGGGIVLNMARAAKDLDAVVSFHGSLTPFFSAVPGAFKGKIAVFNGAADPFVTEEQISAFEKEMQTANIDFSFVNYPDVVHSFTNPGADAIGEKFGMPVKYDAEADADSWNKMLLLFEETFQ